MKLGYDLKHKNILIFLFSFYYAINMTAEIQIKVHLTATDSQLLPVI